MTGFVVQGHTHIYSQYLVWPPFASRSATHLLRIELIRLLIVACGMLVHCSSMAVRICWILAGTGQRCQNLGCSGFIPTPLNPSYSIYFVTAMLQCTSSSRSSTSSSLFLTPVCLQSCLNSSWHRFNKVLETFLRDFGPYWHDSITQFLQICRLHIHDVNLPFHHIPKVLYWIEIWWLWRPFE